MPTGDRRHETREKSPLPSRREENCTGDAARVGKQEGGEVFPRLARCASNDSKDSQQYNKAKGHRTTVSNYQSARTMESCQRVKSHTLSTNMGRENSASGDITSEPVSGMCKPIYLITFSALFSLKIQIRILYYIY